MSDYASLKVPGPTVTGLTAPFWEAASEGKLVLQRCTRCREAIFYPRPICPYCWSPNLTWEQAAGTGTITTFSQIWKPGHPGWLPIAPYYVGLVKLPEGPTMLSHILTDGMDMHVGADVELVPTQTGENLLPFFRTTQKTRSE